MARAYATEALVTGASGVAPQLATIASAQVGLYLDLTKHLFDLGRFGDTSDHYHALLTAHFLAMSPYGEDLGFGAKGPVSAEAHGPASRSYAVGALDMSDDGLSATHWGRMAKAIRARIRGRGSMIRVGTSRGQKT